MRAPMPLPLARFGFAGPPGAGPPGEVCAPLDFEADPRSAPNPQSFATRKFNDIWPGLRPKLRGTSFSSGVGFGSSRPYWVWISPGLFGSVANPGRPLNSVVPYRSFPAVMSKGEPDCITM